MLTGKEVEGENEELNDAKVSWPEKADSMCV